MQPFQTYFFLNPTQFFSLKCIFSDFATPNTIFIYTYMFRKEGNEARKGKSWFSRGTTYNNVYLVRLNKITNINIMLETNNFII